MFEIAFSQQFQRASPLAGLIFGELFFHFSRDLSAIQIYGRTLVKGSETDELRRLDYVFCLTRELAVRYEVDEFDRRGTGKSFFKASSG